MYMKMALEMSTAPTLVFMGLGVVAALYLWFKIVEKFGD